MAKLTILGSAAAVPDEQHNNTYMLLQGEHDHILIDCAGCPLQTLQRAGVDLGKLEYLVVTHRHPDHIYGVPALILGLWLRGRARPLKVYGEQQSLATISALLEIFRSEEWPLLFPLVYYEIALKPKQLVLETAEFRITSSPSKHLVPTLALRIYSKQSGKTLVYSSDTEPCQEVVDLARSADILIHEATGQQIGHSSSAQAGEAARLSGAQELILIHLSVIDADLEDCRRQAAIAFGGPVRIAQDFATFEF
jgi:ribonuclease Z